MGKYVILNIGKNQLIIVTNAEDEGKFIVGQSGKNVSTTVQFFLLILWCVFGL